jgi:DNA-binding NarL/FixJ family response regulator
MVMHDQSRILFELSGGEQVLLDASRAQEFPGREKPFIVTLRRCDHRSVTQDLLALHPCLTEKEAEVLAGLAAGKPIKSIAEYLEKSKVTVGLQARSAMSKLGITNLNALQTYALLNSRLCAASRNRYSGQPV